MKTEFRADVELLRGVAVILVVFYHLDLPYFPSGFIGVDIFFVLSGYLIAKIYEEYPNPLNFYERRFRRILPAMLVVLLVFLAVSPFYFLPSDVAKTIDSAIGILLYVPNVIFWRDNDYFAELQFSPMLHYWSLGVEIQFYFLFPLIYITIKRWAWTLIPILLLSLVLCIGVTEFSAKTAFFGLPTRLWEFLFGCCAFYIGRSGVQNTYRFLRKSNVVFFSSILFLLLASVVAIPQEEFPGAYAIIPVVLSAVAIVYGNGSASYFENAFFKSIRWIAKISFSIYLVHYPVIAIYRYAPFSSDASSIPGLHVILLILVTLMLSAISYRFIESPFRNSKALSRKLFLLIIAALYVATISVLIFFKQNNYFVDSLPLDERRVVAGVMDRGGWRCTKLQKLKEYSSDSCFLLRDQSSKKNFYLVGDSHIDVLKEVFVDEAVGHSISIRINKTRCLLGTYQCSSKEIQKAIADYNVTDVVLHGYAYKLFDYQDVISLLQDLKESEVTVHIIGPVPTYNTSVPNSIFQEIKEGKSNLERITKDQFEKSVPSEYRRFQEVASIYQNVKFYYPERYLCEPDCVLGNEETIFYFDSNHLNLTGARELNELIRNILFH